MLAIAVAAAIAFVLRQRRAPNPALRPHVAGRRIFWVAACAGIIVFGSLMGSAFISQQYLQNVLGYTTFEAGAAILPGDRLHDPRRPAIGEARRLARGTGDTPLRLRLPPARLRLDAPLLERGHLVLAGRPGLRVHRDRGRARGDARLVLADGIRPGGARRDGVRHGRSPAGPGRGADDVDLRRAAHRRLRGGRRERARRFAGRGADHRVDPGPAGDVVFGGGGRRAAVPGVRHADHGRGEGIVPRGCRCRLPRRHRRDPARGRARLLRLPEEGRRADAARPIHAEDTGATA